MSNDHTYLPKSIAGVLDDPSCFTVWHTLANLSLSMIAQISFGQFYFVMCRYQKIVMIYVFPYSKGFIRKRSWNSTHKVIRISFLGNTLNSTHFWVNLSVHLLFNQTQFSLNFSELFCFFCPIFCKFLQKHSTQKDISLFFAIFSIYIPLFIRPPLKSTTEKKMKRTHRTVRRSKTASMSA